MFDDPIFIIRPRSTSPRLVQLDDLDTVNADSIAPHAFIVLETSPGNSQAWVAVSDAPKENDTFPLGNLVHAQHAQQALGEAHLDCAQAEQPSPNTDTSTAKNRRRHPANVR